MDDLDGVIWKRASAPSEKPALLKKPIDSTINKLQQSFKSFFRGGGGAGLSTPKVETAASALPVSRKPLQKLDIPSPAGKPPRKESLADIAKRLKKELRR